MDQDCHSTIPHIYSMWGNMGAEVNMNPVAPPDPTPDAIIVSGLQSTFLTAIGDIITGRIALNSVRKALGAQLAQVIAAHDDMVTAFQNAATQQYPELANQSAAQIYDLLQTLSPDHPLWGIFQPYSSGLADAENQIASLAQQYSDNYTQEQDLAYKENSMCVTYDNYLDDNGLTQYPHSADLLPTLPDPQEINAQVDLGTLSQLSMLDLVNPNVEFAVVKVLAAQDGQIVPVSCENLPTRDPSLFDSVAVDYQTQEDPSLSPSPSMAPQNAIRAAPVQTIDDGNGNQVASSVVDASGMPQPSATLPSQNLNPDGSPAPAIHPAMLAVALAALAYVLLGS